MVFDHVVDEAAFEKDGALVVSERAFHLDLFFLGLVKNFDVAPLSNRIVDAFDF